MTPKPEQRKIVASDKSEIIAKVPMACADEDAAFKFMEDLRWGDSPRCPHCEAGDVYAMRDRKTGERNRRYLWRCRGCGKQYTVRIGTVLEDSRIPLRHWCFAFWAASASKKGVSALQIKRQTGLSYKSALFLLHRIRFAMAGSAPMQTGQLQGTIEADETYVGGKPRRYSGQKSKRGRGTKKAIVMALVERGGGVHARVIPNVTARTLKGAIRDLVSPWSSIITDEWVSYRGIGREFAGGHKTVNHGKGEYSRNGTNTNNAESFFSLLKRGIIGTYHSVSRKHLHRYVDEFAFRFSARYVDDGQRLAWAVQGAEGKRLLYKD